MSDRYMREMENVGGREGSGPMIAAHEVAQLMEGANAGPDGNMRTWVTNFQKKYKSLENLLTELKVHPLNGIDDSTVQTRKRLYGENKDRVRPVTGILERVFDRILSDKLEILVAVCAIISLVTGLVIDSGRTGPWISDLVVLLMWIGGVFFESYQEAKKIAEMDLLADRAKAIILTKVIRSGEIQEISQTNLVVGDIVILESGADIPGDGILLRTHDLCIDESSLTGESEAVKKSNLPEVFQIANNPEAILPNAFASRGTKVFDGKGQLLVMGVGENTLMGRIMQHIHPMGEEEPTKLQQSLERFSEQCGQHSTTILALITISQFVWLVWDFTTGTSRWTATHTRNLVHCVYMPVVLGYFFGSIIFSLPTLVTFVAASKMREFLMASCLIRKISAVEYFGAIDKLALAPESFLRSDKIRVRALHGSSQMNSIIELKATASVGALQQIFTSVQATCSSAEPRPNIDVAVSDYFQSEQETLKAATRGLKTLASRTSGRKFQWVIQTEDGIFLIERAALEPNLSNCTKQLNLKTNVSESLDSAAKSKLVELTERYRTASLSFKPLTESEAYAIQQDQDKFESQATSMTHLIAFTFGLPVQPGAKEFLQDLQALGVQPVIITGDAKHSLEILVEELGLQNQDGQNRLIVEGAALNDIHQHEIDEIVTLCRATPEKKHSLVSRLIESPTSRIVCVIGEGISDFPAMKRAQLSLTVQGEGSNGDSIADAFLMNRNPNGLLQCIIIGRQMLQLTLSSVITLALGLSTVTVAAVSQALLFGGALLSTSSILYLSFVIVYLVSFAAVFGKPGRIDRPFAEFSRVVEKNWARVGLKQTLFSAAAVLVLVYCSENKQRPAVLLTAVITLAFAGIWWQKPSSQQVATIPAAITAIGLVAHVAVMWFGYSLLGFESPGISLTALCGCLVLLPLQILVVRQV